MDDEHLKRLRAGKEGIRGFAEMFERLLGTTRDPTGKAILVRNLAEADQMLADVNDAIADKTREE